MGEMKREVEIEIKGNRGGYVCFDAESILA